MEIACTSRAVLATRLYEIGSAVTLFQVANNAEEFLDALNGVPTKATEVDAVSAVEIAVKADESVED